MFVVHTYKHPTLTVLHCSKQNESIKSGPMDILLDFETSKDIYDSTLAYCLIIHDKSSTHAPSTNMISKVVKVIHTPQTFCKVVLLFISNSHANILSSTLNVCLKFSHLLLSMIHSIVDFTMAKTRKIF